MTDELDTLRPEVRKLIENMSAECQPFGWAVIRSELLRLAKVETYFDLHAPPTPDEWRALCARAEKAEAELAALKARIAESAHLEVTLGCAIDGEIPPDLALCKVALVKMENDDV